MSNRICKTISVLCTIVISIGMLPIPNIANGKETNIVAIMPTDVQSPDSPPRQSAFSESPSDDCDIDLESIADETLVSDAPMLSTASQDDITTEPSQSGDDNYLFGSLSTEDPPIGSPDAIMSVFADDHSSWTEFTEYTTDLSGGSYILKRNVSLDSVLYIHDLSSPVDIDLNGHVLDLLDGPHGIRLESGILNIYDSNPNAVHHYDISSMPYVWDPSETSGTIITGGCITGAVNRYEPDHVGNSDHSSNTSGAALCCLDGSTLNMYGGNLIGNLSDIRNVANDISCGAGGAAIGLNNGSSANLYKCKIMGNCSRDGNDDGTPVESGAIVTSAGGAIFNQDGRLYIGEDAIISNNRSRDWGGGIILLNNNNDATTGGVENHGTISNNTSNNAGGIYYENSFVTNYGTISENKAISMGGGIYARDNTPLHPISNYGKIENNTATVAAGVTTTGKIINYAGASISYNRCVAYTASQSQGGGIYISRGEIHNYGEINGNSSAFGGGIMSFTASGTVTNYSTGTISSNTTTGSGAGIYSLGNVDNYGTISNNSGNYGAGMYIQGGATRNHENATISGNTAVNYGGGAYIVATATSFSNDGAIDNNTANRGGGVWAGAPTFSNTGSISDNSAASFGGGMFYNGVASFENSGSIDRNRAESGSGGGILFTGTMNGTITNSGTINNNYCGSGGGGIFAEQQGDDVKIINDGDISHNEAGVGGGGINAYSTATTKITNNGTITYNAAASNGGGICNAVGAPVVNSGTGKINNNTANNGSGVYAIGPLENSGEINGNAAASYGGGVYVSTSATAFYNDGTIDNNTANRGGGVWSAISSWSNGGSISGNTASTWGGGIFGSNLFVFTNTGSINNNATTANAGGGILLTGSSASNIVNAGNICGNTAGTNGGGVYTEQKSSDATITNNGLVSDNHAGNQGGGIFSHSSSIGEIVNSGTIARNTSDAHGGGVLNSASVSFTNMESGVISNNTGSTGGGICAMGATVNYGEIHDNDSTGTGGGVCVQAGATFDNYGAIYKNEGQWGGGVGTLSNSAFTNHPTGDIYENVGAFGGGAYTKEIATLNGKIRDNSTTNRGGGIYVYDGTTTNNGEITGNHASVASGGGGEIGKAGTLVNSTTGKINGNDATVDGGGLNCLGTLENAGEICDNSCANSGGGVWIGNVATVTNTGSISRNASNSAGGGIYVYHDGDDNGTLFNHGRISDNESDSSGGGIYNDGIAYNYDGGVISGNRAESGGGIYANGPKTANYGTISTNTATSSFAGGGVYVADDDTAETIIGEACTITGNVSDGKTNNLMIAGADSIVRVDEENKLVPTSRIGVTILNESGNDYSDGIVTDSGYAVANYDTGDTNPTAFFFSDSAYYSVGLTDEHEVLLYLPITLPMTGQIGIPLASSLAGLAIVTLIAVLSWKRARKVSRP